MKRILFAILIGALLGLSIASLTQWYFNGECIAHNFDRAVIAPQGVYCFVDRVELVRPYMLLRDLIERDAKPPTYDPRMKIIFPQDIG